MSLYGYKKKTRPAPWTLTAEHLKRATANTKTEYTKVKAAWRQQIKGTTCPVMLAMFGKSRPVSPNPHHIYGRQGKLLCWTPGWMAVSEEGHRFIHDNIEIARGYGWIAKRGDWNNQKLVGKYGL